MTEETKKKINVLEADLKKVKSNNNYGFTKIKNIVCNETDIDQLLFIIKCINLKDLDLEIQKDLKEKKPLEEVINKYFSKSPLYTEAVDRILRKYEII